MYGANNGVVSAGQAWLNLGHYDFSRRKETMFLVHHVFHAAAQPASEHGRQQKKKKPGQYRNALRELHPAVNMDSW